MKIPVRILAPCAALVLWLIPLVPRTASPEAPPPPLRPNRDYALFFAVDDYRPGSGFAPLSKPIANAEAIARELRDRYGFATEVVKNPTLDQIGAKLREYRDLFAKNPSGRYPANGQLLLYFSGHGVAENNNGYFVPTDGDLKKLYSTAFAYEIWRPFINSMDCRHILIAVDACYSVTFDPDWYSPSMDELDFGRPGERSEGDKLLLANESDKCRILFTSDGREDKVPERSNFARKFLEGLQNGTRQDGVLTSTILAGFLDFAAPKPRLTTFGGDEKGSFVFVSVKPRLPDLVADPAVADQLARDLTAWRAAKSANTIAAYRQYLSDYPNGEFHEQADNAIRAIQADLDLRRDDLAWDVATEKNTEQAYRKYQADFPQGRRHAEAGERIKRLQAPATPELMVLVRGGSFEMGDQFGDGSSDEKPVHTVILSDFYLGKTEVTVGEFRAFITATGYKTDAEKGDGSYAWDGSGWNKKAGVNWRHDEEGKSRTADNYPVVHVSWNDAVAYCNWLSERQNLKKVYTISGSTVTADWTADGYRLPTEAEWEYAARSGGKKYKYAWGNGDPNGNIADETARKKHSDWTIWTGYTDGYAYASPAGRFPQGDLGLSDMTGNVWEWCWDWYDSGYYGKSERNNPRGPGSESSRVLRGGSWNRKPALVRAANRRGIVPSFRLDDCGFRLARAARGG